MVMLTTTIVVCLAHIAKPAQMGFANMERALDAENFMLVCVIPAHTPVSTSEWLLCLFLKHDRLGGGPYHDRKKGIESPRRLGFGRGKWLKKWTRLSPMRFLNAFRVQMSH
jgi:hypothetical protein